MGPRPARAVAAYLLHRTDRVGGGGVTPLKLQKLLYYVQAWSLALDARPAFTDPVEAWEHGPVVPDVYHLYKGYGWRPIDPPAPAEVPDLDEHEAVRIEGVLAVYGELSGTQLERMTHAEEPWVEARRDAEPQARPEIDPETMARYYRTNRPPERADEA